MRSAIERPILRTRSANVAKCSTGGGFDVVDDADFADTDEAWILMSLRASPMAVIRVASVGVGTGVEVPALRCGERVVTGRAEAGAMTGAMLGAVLGVAGDAVLVVVFFVALFPVTFFFAVAFFLAVVFLFAVVFLTAAFRAPPPFDPPLVLFVPMRFSPLASVVEIGASAARVRSAPPADGAGTRVGPQIPQGRVGHRPIAWLLRRTASGRRHSFERSARGLRPHVGCVRSGVSESGGPERPRRASFLAPVC